MTAESLRWLPNPAQRSLLALALGAEVAPDEIRGWRREVSFDDLDHASAELLPLLASRLGPLGTDTDPDAADDSGDAFGRLLGLRRRCFYANTLALGQVERVMSAMEAEGVVAILAGGLAALAAYPDTSCRPLPDAELLVAAPHADRAAAVLQAQGWARHPDGRWHTRGCAGLTLVHRLRGTELGVVDDVGLVPTVVSPLTGTERPMLAAEAMVVEVAVAAVWPSAHPPLRWVADLHHLAGGSPSSDAVVRHARAHGAVGLTFVAAHAARRCGAGEVPGSLVAHLARSRVTAADRTAVVSRAGLSATRVRMLRLGALGAGRGTGGSR